MYVYLAPQGKILTFAMNAIPVLPGQSAKNKPAPAYSVNLPYGTCIKALQLSLERKIVVTTEGRFELEKYLHSVSIEP